MKILLPVLCLMLSVARAGEVSIVDVRVECANTCTFSVTLEHADAGWGHYADRWDVVSLDGRLIKTRVLHHPHDDEQPFTRSLSGVPISPEIKQVKIRARDSKHGYSQQEFIVDLPPRN